jgi:vacuolar-type H+-ATPase subunit I/STV1
MKKNRIIALGLEARANELRSSIEPEYSVREIAEILTKESGQTVYHQSVQRYFEQPAHQDPVIKQVQQRTAVIEQATADRLDAVQQLKDINKTTYSLLDQLKDDDGKILLSGGYLALAAIDRIQKQLELQAKLLGDLPSGPVINITLVQAQFTEFKTVVKEVMCPECQRRLAERLRAGLVPATPREH